MNDRGQILLPGLAWFFGLSAALALLVGWGERTLRQERMETAAMAAALSAARAQAYLLNQRAAHNLAVNAFVKGRYKGFGAMDAGSVGPFETWLRLEAVRRDAQNIQSYWNGLKGYPAAVGHQAAKQNGAGESLCRSNLDIRLQLKDLKVFVFLPGPPYVVLKKFFNVYFTRRWGYDQRKIQPPHQVVWSVSGGRAQATSAARVYLDVKKGEPLQNGGFPRERGESVAGDLAVQSFYPQFNARLASF